MWLLIFCLVQNFFQLLLQGTQFHNWTSCLLRFRLFNLGPFLVKLVDRQKGVAVFLLDDREVFVRPKDLGALASSQLVPIRQLMVLFCPLHGPLSCLGSGRGILFFQGLADGEERWFFVPGN